MLPSFAKQSITVVTAGTKTIHGNVTDDWSNPAQLVTVAGCSVQPIAGSEAHDHRDASLAQWQVFAPLGTAVTAKNHIRFGGTEFQIVGEPLRWEVGTSVDHVAILINKWEG